MKHFAIVICLCSLSAVAQVEMHTEGRFRGINKCPSIVLWPHANRWEVWTRSEWYPGEVVNSADFPSIRRQFGTTALVGIGFSEVKVMAGFQNGEFIKGFHMHSQNDDGRFWYNILMIHKPPLGADEFRLDGELDFQYYARPYAASTNRRTRITTQSMLGAMLRLECYEPVPLVIHSGVALRKLTEKSKVQRTAARRQSDFESRLNGKSPRAEKPDMSASVFTLIAGPSFFFPKNLGSNLVVKMTF